MLLINASMLLYFPQKYQYQNQQQIALAQKTVMTAMSPRSTIIPATTQSLFLTYASPILGIEMQYPSSWKKLEHTNSVKFLSPLEDPSDRFREGLGIIAFPVNNNDNRLSIDRIALETINIDREQLQDFQLIKSKASTFDDNPSHVLVYTYTNPNSIKIKAMDVGILDGNKIYVISYFAELSKYPTYLLTIQKMIDSLEIVNPTSSDNPKQTI
jgi:eukaryotic-like serine/threonine-protein kinase